MIVKGGGGSAVPTNATKLEYCLPSNDDSAGGLFITVCLFAGLLCKIFLTDYIPVPYTVVVLIVGGGLGTLAWIAEHETKVNNWYCQSTYTWILLDPHTLLYTFLPALIFASAHRVEYQTFVREFPQILTFATIGVGLSVLLVGFFSHAVFGELFDYGWDIPTSCCLGAIVSATDPVAVVALLHELGAPHRLSILIEGESLFNDGTALVVFFVFFEQMKMAPEDRGFSADQIVLFIRLALGGLALGYVSGLALEYALTKTTNAVEEITITLAAAYGVFLLGEGLLHVSGVLAIVAMGIMYSYSGKTRIEHLDSMAHFWSFLDYVANTTLFAISGAIIADVVMDGGFDMVDLALTIIFYIALMVIRTSVIFALFPLIQRCGYRRKEFFCCGRDRNVDEDDSDRIMVRTKRIEGKRTIHELKQTRDEYEWKVKTSSSDDDVRAHGVTWKEALVLAFGGLRGAVGLALAIIVVEESHSNKYIDEIQADKLLFHVAVFVTLTLVINGTQTGRLVNFLELTRMTESNKRLFVDAVNLIEHKTREKILEYQEEAAKKNASSPFYFVSWSKVFDLMPSYSVEMLKRRYEQSEEFRKKPKVTNDEMGSSNFIPLSKDAFLALKRSHPMHKVADRFGQEKRLHDLCVAHDQIHQDLGHATQFTGKKNSVSKTQLARLAGLADEMLKGGLAPKSDFNRHDGDDSTKVDDMQESDDVTMSTEDNSSLTSMKSHDVFENQRSVNSFHVVVDGGATHNKTTVIQIDTPQNDKKGRLKIIHNYHDPQFFTKENQSLFWRYYGAHLTEMRVRFLQMLKARYEEMHEEGNLSAMATRILQIQADKAIDECFEGKQIRDWVTPTPSGHAHLAKRFADALPFCNLFKGLSDQLFYADAVNHADVIFKYIDAHEMALDAWVTNQKAVHIKLKQIKYDPRRANDLDLNPWQPGVMEVVRYDVERNLADARRAKRTFSADEVAQDVITKSCAELLLKHASLTAKRLHHRGMLDHSELELVDEMIEHNRERIEKVVHHKHESDEEIAYRVLRKMLYSFNDPVSIDDTDQAKNNLHDIAANCMTKRVYEPNQKIFMQGDSADSIFLIALGTVRIFHVPDWDERARASVVASGQDKSTKRNVNRSFIESVTSRFFGTNDAASSDTYDGAEMTKMDFEGKEEKNEEGTEEGSISDKTFRRGDIVQIIDSQSPRLGELADVRASEDNNGMLRVSMRRDGKDKSINMRTVSLCTPRNVRTRIRKTDSPKQPLDKHFKNTVESDNIADSRNLLNVFTCIAMAQFDTRAYEVDDVCRVTKVGRQTGNLCKVLDPFWLKTRVKVQMEESGEIKSYLPSELNLIQAASETSKPAHCKLKPYDSVRVTKKSAYGEIGIVYSINKSGLCKVRMISGGYRDFGDYDLEKILESKVHEDVYSEMLREYMESGDALGYKVCDRSIGSLLGDLGVFTTGRREVTTQAISNVVAYEIDLAKLKAHLQKTTNTLNDNVIAAGDDNIDEGSSGMSNAPLHYSKASKHPKIPFHWNEKIIKSDFESEFDTVRTKCAALIAARLSLPSMPGIGLSVDKCLQGSNVSIVKGDDESSVLKETIDCFAIIVSGKLLKSDNISMAQTHDLRYFFGTPTKKIYIEVGAYGKIAPRILKIRGILNMRAQAKFEEEQLKRKMEGKDEEKEER